MTHPSRPLSPREIVDLGYEPTRRGWRPISEVTIDALGKVEERLAEARGRPRERALVIDGPPRPCVVCGSPAEPSLVETPTCSTVCLGELSDAVFPAIADRLRTRPDGTGGTAQVQPPAKPKPRPRPIPADGAPSLERAVERLGSPRDVLERHGVHLRGRMVLCPFHLNERTPAMSLYEHGGRARAHCHACAWDGDALDLEAALAGEDLRTTIRRWST